MTSQLQSELLKAASSTFEQLGFVFPETDVEDRQRAMPLTFTARVEFRGPVSGSLRVSVSSALATEMAANMLAIFGDPDHQMRLDALGEVANVICGNVVPALGKPGDVFDLDAPELATGAPEPSVPSSERVHLELGVDDGRAELELCLVPTAAGVASR